MSHISNDKIESYISGMADESLESEVENHLDSCEHCFAAYLELIEAQPFEFELSDDFTNQTIEKIYEQNPSSINQKSSNQSNKAITHYLLAAGLTIVLMVTGVFQNILTVTNITNLDDNPSISEQLLEKTSGVLDHIKGEYK